LGYSQNVYINWVNSIQETKDSECKNEDFTSSECDNIMIKMEGRNFDYTVMTPYSGAYSTYPPVQKLNNAKSIPQFKNDVLVTDVPVTSPNTQITTVNVLENKMVTLSGQIPPQLQNSVVTFMWNQISGEPISLSGSNTKDTAFMAPYVDTTEKILDFEVIVTDPYGNTSSDIIRVIVKDTPRLQKNSNEDLTEIKEIKVKEKEGGGCLIATATYGSELAPQVQQLRELRDNSLLQTASGTSFMTGFDQFYYTFSPIVADWERENPAFKEMVKITLTPMISSLSILNYVNMDSEVGVLGYGISLIMLNVGMYFVAPAIVIHNIRKKFH
jgi:hypothetical protein